MKKILFIDTGLEYGGGSKSLIYLLDGIKNDKNYEISVFFENDYKVFNGFISDIIKDIGVNFISFKPKPKISKIKKEFYRLFSKKLLEKELYKIELDFAISLLKTTKPDAIHLNNHFSTNLAYIQAANILGIKVIQHLRKVSSISKFKLDKLKNLDFVPICVSNATYESYNCQINIPKNVIYNPVQINKTSINKTQNDKIKIIMPANFLSLKGHDLAFEAFLKLKRDDIELSLAGNGKFEKKTQLKFEKLLKLGKIKDLGFIKNMDELYMQSDFVFGFSENEGLPRVVIEGLSYGCGIIFSDIPVIKELYAIAKNKENFFIVKRDADSLLDTLNKLKKQNSKIQDENIIKTFSKENYISKVIQIYKKYL